LELVVAITGASGTIYGIRLLEELKKVRVSTHLIMTRFALMNLKYETEYDESYVKGLADRVYAEEDMGAPIASGSYRTDGMAIVPCSMKTLSAIANGLEINLVTRAASVALKERRSLVLMVRETPLNVIQLENMLKVARAGAFIMPASPPFYTKPKSVDDMVNSMVGRVLDLFGIEHSLYRRWQGLNQ
jgi:4-hydroxy-3-polyprenylbenzoate decarboxylase